MPNENTTNCFKLMKNHSPSINKVVILIHGFLNGFETGWLHTMKDSIQTVEPNTAAIIVGWGRGMVSLLFDIPICSSMYYLLFEKNVSFFILTFQIYRKIKKNMQLYFLRNDKDDILEFTVNFFISS